MMIKLPPPLLASQAALLVVDIQDKLLPTMHEGHACVEAARRMIEAAKVLDLPVIATEQYPSGLGRTCSAIRESLGEAPTFEKMRFSGCIEQVVAGLRQVNRSMVLIVGIEAHVCVQQTVLDLLRLGHLVYVCADAVTSRRALDRDIALDRMRQSGAIVTTTESAIFEILTEAGTERFKKVLKIVK